MGAFYLTSVFLHVTITLELKLVTENIHEVS